jgi:hypothetical protein
MSRHEHNTAAGLVAGHCQFVRAGSVCAVFGLDCWRAGKIDAIAAVLRPVLDPLLRRCRSKGAEHEEEEGEESQLLMDHGPRPHAHRVLIRANNSPTAPPPSKPAAMMR